MASSNIYGCGFCICFSSFHTRSWIAPERNFESLDTSCKNSKIYGFLDGFWTELRRSAAGCFLENFENSRVPVPT
ncbi:uncharacterized protein OCT59_002085 [Rhizophagus irregularis]|uniref:Uncharacterized protein n=1 Tax=Rhizophagus irregularis (strain DAOM 181602 / DAOM 197198 / MUCL 43194) TaxID=747089 RepID=U9TUM2_RHIID|nr:hypothetical protein OCT59_002085 [Rhizophagus irregularis]